jgi:crotonobetainyl-CoA:carnitine CoA-transferase CaiB-like acyl-CoA transferase
VYGRVTGWGQQGPLARSAGHDINYAALSGALSLAGHQNELPLPPPTLVGDVAGGALYLAVGMLAAIMKARETGQGNVVDAAVVDGTAHMMNLVLTMVAAGAVDFQRGNSMMNGAPWYDSYRCACGGAITVGPIESKFYRMLLERLGLENHPAFLNQYNKASWPTQRETLTKVFLGHDVAHWQQVLEGSDVCFAPVLNPIQASEHHHMKARRAYFTSDGYLQAAPAPRFREGWSMSRGPVRERGADSEDILRSLGRSETQIAEMRNEGVIG